LCLVSDCSRALDMPPGLYRLGPNETGEPVEHNGVVGLLPGTDKLASSVVAMDHMVRTMLQNTDADLPQVIRMSSLTPAELTGLETDRGSLEPGKLADVVVLSSNLQVERTFIGGVEISAR
jgi:N-acetylglucosamine-6-phosphate deacetylase